MTCSRVSATSAATPGAAAHHAVKRHARHHRHGGQDVEQRADRVAEQPERRHHRAEQRVAGGREDRLDARDERVAVEAGTSLGWKEYVGTDGRVVAAALGDIPDNVRVTVRL